MKKLLVVLLSFLLMSCTVEIAETDPNEVEKPSVIDVEDEPLVEQNIEDIVSYFNVLYADTSPTVFNENIDGVITHVNTHEKIVFLTFDACGGQPQKEIDYKLINLLIENNVEATLFINGRWIESNLQMFKELVANELFDIQNHGFSHKPLSVNGQRAYGITGTESIEEVIIEVIKNRDLIGEYVETKPNYFRSGTAYYDNIAIEILTELNIKAINYNILGDAGATFSKQQMINQAKTVTPGSIFLYHMNKPSSSIADAMAEIIPMLKEMGYTFKKLIDYDEHLQ